MILKLSRFSLWQPHQTSPCPHSPTLEHACAIFITPFKALHLGPQVGFPLPGCHSYGSLKSSVSQREANRLSLRSRSFEWLLNTDAVTSTHLVCISINPDRGRSNDCQMLHVALRSGLLIKWKVTAWMHKVWVFGWSVAICEEYHLLVYSVCHQICAQQHLNREYEAC